MSPSRAIAVTFLLLVACRSTDHAGNQFVSPQPLPQDPLETIARYEDARTDGDGLLQTLMQKGDARTRERAAVALGRLDRTDFGAEVTDGLVLGLGDESGSVRAAAAFGLGERADASAAGALLAHWHDPDPSVRARIVEAGSRIDDARLRAAVVASLDDADARVRREAVLGIARFPPTRTDALDAETLLVDHIARADSAAKTGAGSEELWCALFTFSRNKSPRPRALVDHVRELCVAGLSSADVRARIFAAKALAEMAVEESSTAALTSALRDPDWRVACEATVALGKQDVLDELPAITEALKNPSAHVRRAACQALGSPRLRGRAETVSSLLESARSDPSPEVRAAVLETEVSLLGHAARDRLDDAAASHDPLTRAAAASAAARFAERNPDPTLLELTRDTNLRVAGIAIEGLGKHAGAAAHDRLVELLSAPDNGLRLAAVTALKDGKMVSAQDGPALVACMQSTTGEISAEVAAAILDASEELPKESSRLIASTAVLHPDPYVRKKLLSSTSFIGCFDTEAVQRQRTSFASTTSNVSPAAPEARLNPRVEVVTSRGTMTFELFPAEAPNHVRNFLELAARHHYDGLTFHRVELDFVIQGGDHRGDGNGGVTWNGAPLRAEFTPRKFVRGSLGMPRNDDPDSGGSQFFVTHRDTPHLDGRYTNFGLLVSGFDTLDAIEVGDRIETVRVVPGQ